MNNRIINIVLVIATVTVMVLLAFRVSFEQLSGSGCSGSQGDSCTFNNRR